MDIYRFADLAIMTTVAAALILSVKMALKAKLSARMHMLIWLVLLVQILCFPVKGLLPESNLALQTYLPSYDVQAMRDSANDTFPSEGRATVLNTDDRLQAGPSTQFAQAAHDAQESAFVAPIVPETVLLSVSLGLFIFFALRHIVFLRKYRALPLCVDTDILELFAECKNEVEIERDIRLKIGSASPMLAGLLRPVIYISDDYDREELRYVLIHELCHYKNKDIWLNVLSAAILCLFWFNPLMWFCFCVFRRDMEIYCDDRVVRITGSRREYATALLKTATGAPFLLATSSLIAGKNETAQRIKRMAALKEPKIWVSTLVALVAVMAAVALMLNGAPMTKTLTYPNSPDIVFDVPAKWIEGMETQDNGDLIFAGGTAGTSYIPVSDEVYSQISAAQNGGDSIIKDTEQAVEMTGLVGNIKGNLPGTVKKFEIIDGYDWSEAIGKYFTATTERDGKRYNWAIGAGRRIYAVWAEEEAATQKELLDILRTAGYIERPEAGLLASAGRDGTSKYYLDEITEDSNHSAQKLLGEYLAAYSEMNLPLDKLAKGYKIHSLEPVALAEDSPVREIYPNAYVYRADYELYPAYKEFYSYDTFNGSDFKVTANGEQRYREKYLLFVENVYLDSNDAADAHKFYFVGFLNPAEQNITLDTDTYQKVDMWYNTEMRDLVLYALQTDYLGNAGRTARIVKALPLSQRIDTSVGTFTAEEDGRGVVLQTVKEPYGLTLNYNITAFNDAVRERCTENANILSRTIGNLGKCKMRLYYEGENGKTVATMEFTLTPGKGADLEKLLVTEAKE